MLYRLAIASAIVATAFAQVPVCVRAPCVVEALQKDQEWEDYKKMYKKTYESPADERERHALFEASKQRVARLNEVNKKAGNAFGINWFSDRCVAHPKAHRALPKLSSSTMPRPVPPFQYPPGLPPSNHPHCLDSVHALTIAASPTR